MGLLPLGTLGGVMWTIPQNWAPQLRAALQRFTLQRVQVCTYSEDRREASGRVEDA